MTYYLGIDTGGTYTDAVLHDPINGVVKTAKSLTTKQDLSIGITGAISQVLPEDPKSVGMVSLSTTLATNAVVEKHGLPVCTILIGQPASALERPDLKSVIAGDPVIMIDGGHNASGHERLVLDLATLEAEVDKVSDRVSAFAVAGYFATRNPSHEQKVRDVLREKTGMPVTCSHELSSQLGAPQRALTAVLNARLIPLIQDLILAVQGKLVEWDIDAPLMVVKGDGSLIAADMALDRPIETIMSGPAASVVGAQFLTDREDILVVDMGGTTTDIALLKNGRPVLDERGATVNGWRTMVEALAVHTVGLGGDSEVSVHANGTTTLGPRRAVPISLLMTQYPALKSVLKEQAERESPKEFDGCFALPQRKAEAGGYRMTGLEARLWEILQEGPMDFENLLSDRSPLQPLRRLVDSGLVIVSTFTPSDAAHILGMHEGWDQEAAEICAHLLARKENLQGIAVFETGRALAEHTMEMVTKQACQTLIQAALASDGCDHSESLDAVSKFLLENAFRSDSEKEAHNSLLNVGTHLQNPIAAIGAPAATYYPAIAKRLSTELIMPKHADVSNAVGAVAGGIQQRVDITVTSPDEGRYRVHAIEGTQDFTEEDKAIACARDFAEKQAMAMAEQAGACDISIEMEVDIRKASNGGRDIFIQGNISALAVGRPKLLKAA